MKFLSTLVLLVFSGLSVFAQVVPASSNGSGVLVVQHKWRVDYRNPSLERDPLQEMRDRAAADRRRIDTENENKTRQEQGMPTRPVQIRDMRPESASVRTATYVYNIKLQNSGSRAIAHITWEYVFSDPETGSEVGRRRFETKRVIGPGKTANLLERSAISPTGTIDASKAGKASSNKYTEQVVIRSVQYSDGSVWKASSN